MTYIEAVEQATRIAIARSHVAFIYTDPSFQFNFRFDMPMELSWPDETRYQTVARIDVDGSLKLVNYQGELCLCGAPMKDGVCSVEGCVCSK